MSLGWCGRDGRLDGYCRRLLVATNRHVSEDDVGELQLTFELGNGRRRAGVFEQRVEAAVLLGDIVRELAIAPLVHADHRRSVRLEEFPQTLELLFDTCLWQIGAQHDHGLIPARFVSSAHGSSFVKRWFLSYHSTHPQPYG